MDMGKGIFLHHEMEIPRCRHAGVYVQVWWEKLRPIIEAKIKDTIKGWTLIMENRVLGEGLAN